MRAQRRQYQYTIIGRQMNGREVTGYYLVRTETGERALYTREATAYLVGRGHVTNCKGRIYNNEMRFMGQGVDFNLLPIGRDAIDKTIEELANMISIIAEIVDGKKTIGYIVRHSNGEQKNLKLEDVIEAAKNGNVINARLKRTLSGQMVLEGINCNLSELYKWDYNKSREQFRRATRHV